MAALTIFANFYIDTEERFLRMRDSFLSFETITAEKWVINVRGRYRDETLGFLRTHLENKLIAYHLNSKEGWFYDSRQMMKDINGDYVLIWMEDQINLAKTSLLDRIVEEMKEKDLEYLPYTIWHKGRLRERYRGVPLKEGVYIDSFEHTLTNNPTIQANLGGSFLISFPSIQKTAFFKKIINTDDPIPRRWPKETPFDFEKRPKATHWLPIRVALPKQELFASIDDNNGVEGYCLQDRGLYPIREGRKTYAIVKRPKYRIFLSYIKAQCKKIVR